MAALPPTDTLPECITSLVHHAPSIGTFAYICLQIPRFPHEEVEFYLPQLCQILITVETESVALEDLLISLATRHPHLALISFWQLQAHLADLSDDPESYGFQVARRVLNALQYVLFHAAAPERPARENCAPAAVLAGSTLAAFGMPRIGEYVGPLAGAQARRQRATVFQLAARAVRAARTAQNTKLNAQTLHTYDRDRDQSTYDLAQGVELGPRVFEPGTLPNSPLFARRTHSTPDFLDAVLVRSASLAKSASVAERAASTSNVTTAAVVDGASDRTVLARSASGRVPSSGRAAPALTGVPAIRLLKANYFQCETQFAIALQLVSARLSQVPKAARLLTLKAELLLMNRDLPAEVDIPTLFPPSKPLKLHKMVRITPNEAAVLNLAEKVPFLLLIEYLRDEVDFDPTSRANMKLLALRTDRRYIFDTGTQLATPVTAPVSVFTPQDEEDLGDLLVVRMKNREEFGETTLDMPVDAAPEDLATHMRIAAVMLTQLDHPGNTLPQDQSAAIKARIIALMQALQDNFGYSAIQKVKGQAGERKLENDIKVGGLTAYLGEDWETKKARVRKELPYGHLDNWELCSVISKTGDDLRQEAFACQLIQAMLKMWRSAGVGVWVKRMRILVTSSLAGLVETITDALSVHLIKKALTERTIADGANPKGTVALLVLHFHTVFGEPGTKRYLVAQNNFAALLAAYLLICYLLQIKDRHNGNIMLDNEGHIIHIDFGFLLLNLPGSVGFEAAPFKLTLEYIEILGGLEGAAFARFKQLLKEAFLVVRKNASHIIEMVELMQKDSGLPCFKAGEQTAAQLKLRFQLGLSDDEVGDFVENVLVGKSIGSLYTRMYDQFQLLTQGIYS